MLGDHHEAGVHPVALQDLVLGDVRWLTPKIRSIVNGIAD
jgi:hypothetical protein